MLVTISAFFIGLCFKHWILWILIGGWFGCGFLEPEGNPFVIRVFAGMFIIMMLTYIPAVICFLISIIIY